MSLLSLLSIARSALLTQQKALDVTGNNVANASTPGYSRERLNVVPAEGQRTPNGLVGRGVTDLGVERSRDVFLDASYRRSSGSLGQFTTLKGSLSQIEAAFNEPSTTGLSATLDQLFGAFSDLANNPSSAAARTLVLQAGGQVAKQLNQLHSQIDSLSAQASTRIDGTVADVNSMTSRIAALNAEIVSAGGPTKSASTLQDQRDLLLDNLSKVIDVRVLPRTDGSVGVIAGDTLIVDGGFAQTIAKQTLSGGGFGVGVQPGSHLIQLGAGDLKALSDLTSTVLPGFKSQLDTLANGIVSSVNALHQVGFNAAGITGTNFFDPTGTTARTIKLDAAVLNNPNGVAAAQIANATGDGRVAQQIADLRTTSLAGLGNLSIQDYYTNVASAVGVAVNDATQSSTSQQTLLDSVGAQRASAIGVSIDEEMVGIITHQQAYAAAAKLVSAADEMIQTILKMV